MLRWQTKVMALRSPLYLDIETLLSQAEYHEIDVPRQAEIVEKTTRKRGGGGKMNFPGVGGADASVGSDVEHQSTYELKPREKATVSKVIDRLISEEAVKTDPDEHTVLSKDDLVEVDGLTRITAASLAGKMFFMIRRLMDTTEGDLDSIFDLGIEDLPVADQVRKVYLQNELLPIPVLLELTGSKLPHKVYVSVAPDHFIDAASANRVEGELRVLGSISHLVPGGDEGFLSAEQWLLHGWEYLMRRKLMTQVDEVVKNLVEQLEIDLPAEDVHAFLSGPAVVIDAVALY